MEQNILQRLRQVISPYRSKFIDKRPIITYDKWTIYLTDDGHCIYLDEDSNETIEVECFTYGEYDSNFNIKNMNKKQICECEKESDCCGEFDDMSGYGYFKIKEDK